MNVLAHLLLSSPMPKYWLGNLMGDFVKGTPHPALGDAFIASVMRHRAIDAFTDAHPAVRKSKQLFSPARRRFAGIILDVGYDYFLCRHWRLYSEIPLEIFITAVYDGLADYLLCPEARVAPPACRHMVERMIADDWLRSYQTLSGVGAALDKLSRRLKRPNTLSGSVEEIAAHEGLLEAEFQQFFPERMVHIGQLPG